MANQIKITKEEVLSQKRYLLKNVTFEHQKEDGTWETQTREIYDRGNAAAILLYNKADKTVILTRQLRFPTYLNGNPSGMLIEVCAGMLDKDNPEEAVRRETEEETGYKVTEVRKVMEAYMSPGGITELLHLFVAEYAKDMRVSEGGGLEEEQEHIEVLEIPFAKALQMIEQGEIKDSKTILLLQYAKIHDLV